MGDIKKKGRYITAGGKVYKVADGVQILDSVTTDGNTYFNLHIKPTDNMEVEAEIIPTRSVIGTLMGSGTNDIDLVCFFNQRDADTFRNIYGNYPSKAVDIDTFNFVNKRIKYKAVVTPTEQTTYINDSLVDTSTFTATGNNVDMYLLGIRFDGSFGSAFVGSLCKISINIDGVDVYKLFAAQKNNVVGVYDLISGQFIAPVTGTLTPGKDTKTINVHQEILADLYQEVEYLGLQGDEHINTAIVPSGKKIGAVIDFQFTNTSRTTGGVFGSNNKDNADNCQLTVYQSKWRTKINRFAHYGALYDTNRHTVRFNMEDGTKLDDTVITATQYTIASSNDNPLFLGKCNYGDGSSEVYSLIGRLYSAKIYVDGVLTLDYVPVKRLSDDTYGLYDTVSKTFFGNAGTGSFTGGSARQMEVPIVDEYCGVKAIYRKITVDGVTSYEEVYNVKKKSETYPNMYIDIWSKGS